MLASAAHDRRIKLWAWPEQQLTGTIEGSWKGPGEIAFTPDSKTLLATGPKSPLVLWHVATGRMLFSIDVPLLRLLPGLKPGQLAALREPGGALWLCDVDF